MALAIISWYSSGRSRPRLSTASDITCQCRSMSRTLAASRTQRLVSQAHGHSGSNQKSTRAAVGALCTASVMNRSSESPGPDRLRPCLLKVQVRHAVRLFPAQRKEPSAPHGKLFRVSAPNLTRTDAAARADLLAVSGYDLQLDVTDGAGHPGEHTFRSVTT